MAFTGKATYSAGSALPEIIVVIGKREAFQVFQLVVQGLLKSCDIDLVKADRGGYQGLSIQPGVL
jgi:hypothetical protein